MGLFSKLRNNLSHGGVKLELGAPGSVKLTDSTLPVSVTITAGETPQTINRVTAEIIAFSQNQAFDPNGNQQAPMTENRTVARVDNNETFNLAPNEAKTVQLEIVMNGGAEALAAATGLDPNSKAGKVANSVVAAFQAGSVEKYRYEVQVSADVAGIKLDPAKNQPLMILAPGQIGGTKTFNL